MSHIENMHKMIECLTDKAKSELDKGVEGVDTKEFGEVVDVIKDLQEAEYKATVVKAMKDAEEDGEFREKIMELTGGEDMRFYNSNRYADGRYAPSGHGNYTRRGYDGEMPFSSTDAMMYDYMPMPYGGYDNRMNQGRMYYTDYSNMSMGSNGGSNRSMGNMNRSSGNSNRSNNGSNNSNGMMGYSESRYDRARRGYSESKEMHKDNTSEDKQAKMASLEEYAKELSNDVTDMIKDASQEERTVLRNKLNLLVSKI